MTAITNEIWQVGGAGYTSPQDAAVYLVVSDGLRVLFGQDVHGPLHDDCASDPDAYRQSLVRMAESGEDILCEGHYGIIRGAGEVNAFIRSFIR
jgi:hypothetical protein